MIGAAGYFMLVPFPDAHPERCWGFLNEKEVAYVVARVNADRGDAATEAFTLGKFLRPGLDPKVWGFALIFCCLTTVSYALAYFLPIILSRGMGFSVGASQCLVAPPCKLHTKLTRKGRSVSNIPQTSSPAWSCSVQPGWETNTTSAVP